MAGRRGVRPTVAVVRVDLITIVVDDYDPAIEFFVEVLGFDLVEDTFLPADDASARLLDELRRA